MGRQLLLTHLSLPIPSHYTQPRQHFSHHALPEQSIDLVDQTRVTKKEAKYLGVWWCQDLSSKKSVVENTNKAHRAFFALGTINKFQGKCNPLTVRSLFSPFGFPIVFYGCESWFLTDLIVTMLNTFQADIGKRILKLPRSHNNLSVRVGLKRRSCMVMIMLRKRTFLAKLLSNTTDSSSHRIIQTLASKGDVFSISVI